MTTIRRFGSGTSPRGFPAFRRPPGRHPVVMLVLALAALSQTGCQSGPFGGCGGCGGKVRNLSERMFRPIRNVVRGSGCKSCNGDLGTPMPPGVQYGYGSPAVVTPAPTITGPSSSGTTTVVPGTSSDTGPPALEPIPSADRVPSATPGPAPSGAGSGGDASGSSTTPSQGSRTSPGKANYEAYHPFYRDSRARSSARAKPLDATPEPTTRSAQGASASSSASSPAADPNPLDNLPLLNLPLDVPQAEQTPPTSPSATREGRTSANTLNSGPAPAAETLADLAAKPAAGGVSVAPGIRRFAGVESKLAGGSLPTAEGLDWLSEKGYKTILDLREDVDASSSFLTEVTRRGMRYLALPINAKSVDADHVSRFNFEVSLADARPLYFCDNDGTRAGVMWYIRRVTVDKVGELVARRDAQEIGLTDSNSQFWLAANAYLAGLKPAAVPAPAPVDTPDPASKPVTPAPAPIKPRVSRPGDPAPSDRADSNAPDAPTAGPSPGDSAEAGRSPNDPMTWKSVAVAAAAGLGIPLAYIGRSIPITFARASLPAPRRSTRSLPGGSDV